MIKKIVALLFVLAVGVVALAVGEEFEPKTWSEFLQYAIQIGVPLAAAVMIGFKNPKELFSKKTTWAGVASIAGALTALLQGAIDAPTAMYAIMAGLALIFIRDGVVSIEKKQDEVIKAAEMIASKERVKGF